MAGYNKFPANAGCSGAGGRSDKEEEWGWGMMVILYSTGSPLRS